MKSNINVTVGTNKRYKPILLKDPETGEVEYTLDFSANTLKQLDNLGFSIQELTTKLSMIRTFIFAAFQKHQRTNKVTNEKDAWSIYSTSVLAMREVDDVDEEEENKDLSDYAYVVSSPVTKRLIDLYTQALNDVNPNVKARTIELD